MRLTICDNKKDLGYQAAKEGARHILRAIKQKGEANVVFVTGKSQVETLRNLATLEIDWSCVNVFHLDAYVGIDISHFAYSSTYLKDNFLSKIGDVKSYYPINPDENKLDETIKVLNEKLETVHLDVGFICIGENGHLAFNDPPAELDVQDPYIIVELEKRSRKQQVGEGWFKKIDDVPSRAITMSIAKISSIEHIVVSCPDQRKARAVASCIFDEVSCLSPSATLKYVNDCCLYLDRLSSCLIFGDRRV